MTWNHRIIKHDLKKPFYLSVHEVFYDDSGKVTSWTANPIDITRENRAEINRLLKQITRDIQTPILSESKLKKEVEDSKIDLILTCDACPEQYEAYLGEKQVGYLRLRHGKFRVDFPDVGGETIYEAYPEGDGNFSNEERDFYLEEALKAIEKKLARKPIKNKGKENNK
jgi:hypothetical protein